jgi:hypothetical protein
VSAQEYVGEPPGVLIEDLPPAAPPEDCVRRLRLDRHSLASEKGRVGIPEIVNDSPCDEHEGIGLGLDFDGPDIPLRLGWYGPMEAVIDDLRPWLGTYTKRELIADHRIRDLRITRGNSPDSRGVTIALWYVPDSEVHGVPPAILARIEGASES